MKMKTKLLFLTLGLGLTFMLSCTKYPPQSERLLEDLAIITQYDTKIDFNNYKTYSIAASIIKITSKDTITLTPSESAKFINQIETNMNNRGFTKVAPTESPDFGIQVVYYQNTYVYAYYGGYWGYDWYGYYYPYYPVYYSSYSAGLANIELIDLKVFQPGSTTRYLRWNAYIRGLLTGSHTDAELLHTIDQAFVQTPQLKTSAQ